MSVALRRSIVGWIAAPCALFVAFFVMPGIGLPMLALLLLSCACACRSDGSLPKGRLPVLTALGFSGLLLLLEGFPSGPFAWDWIKHWALLNTLKDNPWPVVVDLQGEPAYLRFYIAAYLVPAGVSKLLPGLSSALVLGAWFGLGMALLALAIATVSPKRTARQAMVLLVLVLMMGGADWLAQSVLRADAGLAPALLPGAHSENWWVNQSWQQLQLTSVLPALLWVPHQSIPVFLFVTLLLCDHGRHAWATACLVCGLLALWSPYGLIGAVPLLAVKGWQQRLPLSRPTGLAVLAALAFTALVGSMLSHEAPLGSMCLSCGLVRVGAMQDYLLFWLVELGPFALILRRELWRDVFCRVAGCTILVVTLVHGESPDFVMRVTLAPLFVLALRSALRLTKIAGDKRRPAVSAASMVAALLMLPTAATEVAYQLTNGATHLALPVRDVQRQIWTYTFAEHDRYTVIQFLDRCGWRFKPQYFVSSPPPLSPARSGR